jgi:lambda repressor-like predicted transcriptional regulator
MRTPTELMHSLPQTHQIPEAIAALKKSLEYDPDSIWARRFLDIVQAYQKQQAEISAVAARYRVK